jgi:formimidoylglutamate deiminase
MTIIFAPQALLPEGWTDNVRIRIDGATIASVEHDAVPDAGDERHEIVVPGMSNLHSHAFQRAMAGLAERRGTSADTFWTWRETMYRFAQAMTPEDVEKAAAQLYVEMLEAGFCRVGEFHYLHHDVSGQPYANVAEMAERIAAAAAATGISLTLLPVFYAHSTFGGAAPHDGQCRFINDPDRFARLLDESRRALATLVGAVVGVAPHSLRAVTPEELAEVTALAAGGPIHIHAAEQVKEVEDCLAWSGARPVEWLLANAGINRSWCLIHATHMTEAETGALAESGATAGLCPVTEANLGDGVFPARRYLAAGGRFGIGSDSNVLIGVADELRQLEYAQRLAHRERNVLGLANSSTGRRLFEEALAGGAALGAGQAGIAEGNAADLVSLHADHPTLAGKKGDAILDAWIFANGGRVDCVWARGRKLVENGRHTQREPIAEAYRAAMRGLSEA